MIYIKTFEKLLKYNDQKVLDNPLLDFALKLENIIIGIKHLDNFNGSTVKKFFDDHGKITIKYKDNADLLKITMNVHSDTVTMSISYTTFWINDRDKNSKEFYYFAQNKLKRYTTLKTYKSLEIYDFPINKINNVIKVLEGFFDYIELNVATNKYNI